MLPVGSINLAKEGERVMSEFTFRGKKYPISKVTAWHHPDQDKVPTGKLSGHDIFNALKERNLLEHCLGLEVAKQIQEVPLKDFLEMFGQACLFFLGVEGDNADPDKVWYLVPNDGKVVLCETRPDFLVSSAMSVALCLPISV